jgi:hypothetical protein
MQFISISQCGKNLDFIPINDLPKRLLPYAFSGELICGFRHNDNDKAIELDADSLSVMQVFKDIFPVLTLPELSRFIKKLKAHNINWPLDDFLKLYNLRMDQNLERAIALVHQLPMRFQNWLSLKQVGPRELMPLFAHRLSDQDLEKVAQMNPSRTEGVQIIEFMVDITLLGKECPVWNEERADKYIESLKSVRYPLRTESDRLRESRLKLLSWPKRSDVRWHKHTDAPQIEFKTFWQSPIDLKSTIESLQVVLKQTEDKSKSPWQ